MGLWTGKELNVICLHVLLSELHIMTKMNQPEETSFQNPLMDRTYLLKYIFVLINDHTRSQNKYIFINMFSPLKDNMNESAFYTFGTFRWTPKSFYARFQRCKCFVFVIFF